MVSHVNPHTVQYKVIQLLHPDKRETPNSLSLLCTLSSSILKWHTVQFKAKMVSHCKNRKLRKMIRLACFYSSTFFFQILPADQTTTAKAHWTDRLHDSGVMQNTATCLLFSALLFWLALPSMQRLSLPLLCPTTQLALSKAQRKGQSISADMLQRIYRNRLQKTYPLEDIKKTAKRKTANLMNH